MVPWWGLIYNAAFRGFVSTDANSGSESQSRKERSVAKFLIAIFSGEERYKNATSQMVKRES